MANIQRANMVEINAQEFSSKFQSKKEVSRHFHFLIRSFLVMIEIWYQNPIWILFPE